MKLTHTYGNTKHTYLQHRQIDAEDNRMATKAGNRLDVCVVT